MASLSPSTTVTGFLMTRKLCGSSCTRMPALVTRYAKGAALPSMMGTSGPSSSTRTLSMPRPGQRRQQVLHRAHPHAVLAQRGGQRGVDHVLGQRGDGHRARQVRAHEDDAVVRRRGPQREVHRRAGVQPHALAGDGLGEGALVVGEQRHCGVASLTARYENFVTQARSADPDVDLVLSEITQTWFSGAPELNALLAEGVYQMDSPESRVVLADADSGYTRSEHTFDGSHPNAQGEAMIAAAVGDSSGGARRRHRVRSPACRSAAGTADPLGPERFAG